MNLLNLIIHTTITKFMKRHITNSICDYSQCFMTIIAYNLIIKKNNNELKNLSRTNDRIGHLHIE